MCGVHDDIIIFGETWEEFSSNFEKVIARLDDHNFVLKANKCVIGTSSVECLGHICDGEGVRLTEKRVQKVLECPEPKTPTGLRRFIGLCNAFRDHVDGLAHVQGALTKLAAIKKNYKSTFYWEKPQQDAFNEMKDLVRQHHKLFHLTYTHPIVLRTDASQTGVGALLLQVVDGKEQPIVFLSQKFSGPATRWSTIEQEAYGVYWAITKLHSYLMGHPFYVETDHKNLVYIDESSSAKITRWRLQLQQYNFQVVHIAGRTNVVADALSRSFEDETVDEDDSYQTDPRDPIVTKVYYTHVSQPRVAGEPVAASDDLVTHPTTGAIVKRRRNVTRKGRRTS